MHLYPRTYIKYAIYCMFYLNDIDEFKNIVEHLKDDVFSIKTFKRFLQNITVV